MKLLNSNRNYPSTLLLPLTPSLETVQAVFLPFCVETIRYCYVRMAVTYVAYAFFSTFA